jgi:hypothetical protein
MRQLNDYISLFLREWYRLSILFSQAEIVQRLQQTKILKGVCRFWRAAFFFFELAISDFFAIRLSSKEYGLGFPGPSKKERCDSKFQDMLPLSQVKRLYCRTPADG